MFTQPKYGVYNKKNKNFKTKKNERIQDTNIQQTRAGNGIFPQLTQHTRCRKPPDGMGQKMQRPPQRPHCNRTEQKRQTLHTKRGRADNLSSRRTLNPVTPYTRINR